MDPTARAADGTGAPPVPEDDAAERRDDATLAAEEAPEALIDRRIDMAVAGAVAALGAATIVLSNGIREGQLPDPLGAGGLPRVLGGFLVVVGVVLILRRVVSWRRSGHLVDADGGQADEPGHESSTLRAMYMWLAGLSWALLLPRIGYIMSTLLVTAATTAGMRVRSPVKLVAVPVLFTLLTWALFNRVFGLRFPAGPVDLFFQQLVPRVF